MTRLYDDPATFAEDMLAGFLDLHRDRVTGVPGGVIRSTPTRPGKVAVVVGGGSGHYPAFCGVVGSGIADGAVVGNVFTSPSAEDAYSVASAAHSGGGVLFSFGNYAGDVMNFGLAQERLRAEGIDTRTVLVTDDLASAPVEELPRRRGIAGDFVVFKIAGAAAEAGWDLDEVERIAERANTRTRTLGVAFSGCTLPGQGAPLFTVPAGRMGVGLGIHGEPGVSEEALPSAAELATRLVQGVLAERPPDAGPSVAVILNGLGATKYEELFVVWRTVAALLADSGLQVVEPEVGELVTSLDMAGCSLTLVYLDDELERLWCAPADTPAYRKGAAAMAPAGRGLQAPTSLPRHKPARPAAPASGVAASPVSRSCAATAARCLAAMETAIRAAETDLGALDAVAGDGDHGRGMVRGVSAAAAAAAAGADEHAGVATVLAAAGDAWAARAGGTSGVLWGRAVRSFGARLGDAAETIRPSDVAEALRSAQATMQELGRAAVGDKTMLDALVPFIDAYERAVQAGSAVAAAWGEAAVIAEEAAQATAELRPRVGRARPLAERSVGTPDPGAVSLALSVRAISAVLAATPAATGQQHSAR